jgi:hypothetical protein
MTTVVPSIDTMRLPKILSLGDHLQPVDKMPQTDWASVFFDFGTGHGKLCGYRLDPNAFYTITLDPYVETDNVTIQGSRCQGELRSRYITEVKFSYPSVTGKSLVASAYPKRKTPAGLGAERGVTRPGGRFSNIPRTALGYGCLNKSFLIFWTMTGWKKS